MSDTALIKQFDNRCVLSDYVMLEGQQGISIATGSALIRFLWDSSRGMRPNGLKNSVNTDKNQGSEILAMQDVISDAFAFDYNRRDAEYKNFWYDLDTSKPRGRKLRKRFS